MLDLPAVAKARARRALSLFLVAIGALACVGIAGCGGGSGTGSIPTAEASQQVMAVFGNSVAQVALYRTSATYTNGCGTSTLASPIVPDQNGNFTVTGLYPANVGTNALYTGNIDGNTMQLSITDQATGSVIETLTLTRGVSGEFEVGTCP